LYGAAHTDAVPLEGRKAEDKAYRTVQRMEGVNL
jgi:hypothetical protein